MDIHSCCTIDETCTHIRLLAHRFPRPDPSNTEWASSLKNHLEIYASNSQGERHMLPELIVLLCCCCCIHYRFVLVCVFQPFWLGLRTILITCRVQMSFECNPFFPPLDSTHSKFSLDIWRRADPLVRCCCRWKMTENMLKNWVILLWVRKIFHVSKYVYSN